MFAGILIGSSPCLASAADGWEANITVLSGKAKSRLSFGQRLDATNRKDGRYDVPSLLSGRLQVYFTGGGGNFWRDIRAQDQEAIKEWRLIIKSQTGKPVTVRWNQDDLPPDSSVKLIEIVSGHAVDMKSSTVYTPGNNPDCELLIKVMKNPTGET